MHFSRSLFALCIIYFSSFTAQARLARPGYDVIVDTRQGMNAFNRRQSLGGGGECVEDEYITGVLRLRKSSGQKFCNIWLSIPPTNTEVEYTPTVYAIASTGRIVTRVKTSRVTTTTTVTVTAHASARRTVKVDARGVNRVQQIDAIITSAIASDANASATSTDNSERLSLESGLTSACSCLDFEPILTFTSTYTVLPTTEVVRKIRNRHTTETITRTYTVTTTETQASNESAARTLASVLSGTRALSTFNSSIPSGPNTDTFLDSPSTNDIQQPSGSPSFSASNPSFLSKLNTGSRLLVTVINSMPIGPSPTLSVRRPVATGLPFSCPDDSEKRLTNIFGRERFEYVVLCDIAVVTGNEVFTTIKPSPLDCVAECSYINDVFQGELCQAVTFTATPGSDAGECLVSGPTSTFIKSPGSSTAVLLEVYTADDECSAINFADKPANATVVSSAIVASVIAAPLSVATPGLVMSSRDNGEFHTRVTMFETGTDGIVRYSWEGVDATSGSWFAVFQTAWTCSIPSAPKTIEVRLPGIRNSALLEQGNTTIISGNVVTLIYGTATTSFRAGGGAITPYSVPASTTSGDSTLTAGGSTATSIATSNWGAMPPSSSATELHGGYGPPASIGPSLGTTDRGMPPNSTDSSETPLASVTSGTDNQPILSRAFTANTSASGEEILPSLAIDTFAASESHNIRSKGAISSFPFQTRTGGSGGRIVQGISATLSAIVGSAKIFPSPLNATAPEAISSTSGNSHTTIIGDTSMLFSTGGVGSARPLPITLDLTPVLALTSGSVITSGEFNITSSGTTAVISLGGGASASAPRENSLVAAQLSVAPSKSFAVSSTIISTNFVSATSGAPNFFMSGGMAVTLSSGGASVLSPTANASIPSLTTTTPTSSLTTLSTSVESSTSGNFNVLISGSMTVISFASGFGAIIPSANETSAMLPSLTPSGSSNVALTTIGLKFSNSLDDRIGSFSRHRAVTSNSTLPGLSPASILSLANSTELPTGTAAAPTITLSAPKSTWVFGSASSSVAERTGYPGQPSESGPGSPSKIETPSLQTEQPSATILPLVDVNSTGILGSGAFTSVPIVSTNSSSTMGAGQPSITAPPTTASVTSPLPGTTSTGPQFKDLGRGRVGSFSGSRNPANVTSWPWPSVSRPSEAESSSFMPASVNETSSVPSRIGVSDIPYNLTSISTGRASESLPLPSVNVTSEISETPSVSANYTSMRTVSSFILIIPANSTGLDVNGASSIFPTPSIDTSSTSSKSIPTASANFTSARPTGTGIFLGVLLQSANSTGILPTASPSFTGDNRRGSISRTSGPPASTASNSTPENPVSSATVSPSGIISSSGAPVAGANSTSMSGTGVPAPSSSAPVVSENATLSSIIASSAPPMTPSNVSSLASPATTFATGNSTSALLAIGYSDLPLDLTSEICSTPSPTTSVETLLSTIVSTILITHGTTSTIYPPSGSPIASSNSTYYFPIALSYSSPLASSPLTTSPSPIPTIPPIVPRRIANVTATQQQIDAACANKENIIFNPGFELDINNEAFGYTVVREDPFIDFTTHESNDQHTLSGSSSGRILSAAARRSITISQPLTLCPEKQYQLSSWARQYNLLAQCDIQLWIGGNLVYTASPQEAWLRRSAFYTAGSTPEDVSQDLKIVGECAGEGDVPTGTDNDGFMIVDVDDLSLVQED